MAVDTIAILFGVVSSIISFAIAIVALRQRNRQIQLSINESELPDKQKGLIILIGPTLATAPTTIEYHLPELKHCWLVGSDASKTTSDQLIKEYPTVKFYDNSIVDIDTIDSTYKTVLNILTKDIKQTNLEVSEVIADITGGLKTMSAGMVLACREKGCNMEYMKTLRDKEGNAIPNQLPIPIRVDLNLVHN